MTSTQKEEPLNITQAEWKKINAFCHRGQDIIKQSSFGYHRRRLTIDEGILSWQSKSIPLHNIRQLTIGIPPKKLFRKTDGNPALWVAIDGLDRRCVSLLFNDIPSRNLWIRAIIFNVSQLPEPLFAESAQDLQDALSLDGAASNGVTHTLTLSPNGKLRPQIEPTLPDHGGTADTASNPRPLTGLLQLHLICASNLPKADVLSKSDPYVVISNHLGQRVRTKTIPNSHDPMWNEHVTLSVQDQTLISIQIFDEDKHSKDDLLCSCSLNVAVECTASKEIKFHRKMELEPSWKRNHKKISTLTFTALYQPNTTNLSGFNGTDNGNEEVFSLENTVNASSNRLSPQYQAIQGRRVMLQENEESLRSKKSSHSTSDIHVDYLDLHSFQSFKRQDAFHDMVSSKGRTERGFIEEPSIWSRDNTTTTIRIEMDNTVNSMNSATTPSHDQRHGHHSDSSPIDVEESSTATDPLEIQNNPHKLYILLHGTGDKEQSDGTSNIPDNVCYLDLDKVIASKDEQNGIQCIDHEMEAISRKLFRSKPPMFECLVVPNGDVLEQRLNRCSPQLFTYFGREFDRLIANIKDRNVSHLGAHKMTRSVSFVVNDDNATNHIQTELNTVMTDEQSNDSPNRPKPPPIVTDYTITEETACSDISDTNTNTNTNMSGDHPLSSSRASLTSMTSITSRTSKRSMSKMMMDSTIPSKVLQSLGVEPLTKLTLTLMRNGERFRIYGPSNASPTVSKVYLKSDRNGLYIGHNLTIYFNDIVALHSGNAYDSYESHNVDPRASFVIEYTINGTERGIRTNLVMLEVVQREKYLARRNWWMNSIISSVSLCCRRVPPSLSAISKLLNSVTDDKAPCSLRFVEMDDIEDTFSISGSLEMTSVDTESARKKAVQRVKRYKKLQQEIQSMTIASREKQEKAMQRVSKSISVESIPFMDDQGEQSLIMHNLSSVSESNKSDSMTPKPKGKKMKRKRKLSGSSSGITNAIGGTKSSLPVRALNVDIEDKTDGDHILAGDITAPKVKTSNQITPKKQVKAHKNGVGTANVIRFERSSDAMRMRSTITHLTQKLQDMESLQLSQAEKVKQFVDREGTVIARYQSQIKKLRKEKTRLNAETKRIKSKLEMAVKERMDVEKTLRLKQWDRAKSTEQKQSKEKTAVDAMTKEVQDLHEKLEKANSGYKSAMQNYHREQQQRIKLERQCGRLEQRYVCDTQEMKDQLREMTLQTTELKRQCKMLQSSLTQSEKNEKNLHQLLEVEAERSQGLQDQSNALRLQMEKVTESRSNREEERHQKQMDADHRVLELNEEHKILNDQIRDLQRVIRERNAVLSKKEEDIKQLKAEIKTIPKEYQKKLLQFTQYAQEQMNLQQQTLMSQSHHS